MPQDEQLVLHRTILDYVIADARPLSTVDSFYFQRMLNAFNPKSEMISAKILSKMIIEEFKHFKQDLIARLSKVNVVCLTSDI